MSADERGSGSSLRNIGLLSLVQALGGSNTSVVMTVGALTAVNLAPNPAAVTLPVTAMIVGLALSTTMATRIIYRLGRSRGLMVGAGIAIPGALLAALAVMVTHFYLFAAGLFLVGMSGAFIQQVRFAAADSVAPAFKSQAISWVLFGGVAAGFLGPQSSALTRDWIPGAEYAASFLVIALFGLLAILVLIPTRLAPVIAPAAGPDMRAGAAKSPCCAGLNRPAYGRGGAQLCLDDPDYGLRALAMVHVCGHPPEAASGAIQWHVVAMFAPSFVTGAIIRRLGAHLVTAIGLLLIIACAGVALSGIGIINFNISLILLGLGWNFGFIGSTTLLASAYRPEEAGRVQALNEQIVFGSNALASIGSGLLLQTIGWQAINLMAIPLATMAILLLALGNMHRPVT